MKYFWIIMLAAAIGSNALLADDPEVPPFGEPGNMDQWQMHDDAPWNPNGMGKGPGDA
jgi:hypothetical protein